MACYRKLLAVDFETGCAVASVDHTKTGTVADSCLRCTEDSSAAAAVAAASAVVSSLALAAPYKESR